MCTALSLVRRTERRHRGTMPTYGQEDDRWLAHFDLFRKIGFVPTTNQ